MIVAFRCLPAIFGMFYLFYILYLLNTVTIGFVISVWNHKGEEMLLNE